MTKDQDEADELEILATFDHRNYVLLLHSDGYWTGSEGNQIYQDIANHYACWEHWTPDKGDAAVWACEEIVKHLDGKVTAFFSEADMGDPLERGAITP